MKTEYLSHDELQHIEHANKSLESHLELVKLVVNESEKLLDTYVPIMATYLNAIKDIRTAFAHEVTHIYESSRELKVITSGNQEIQNFCSAVDKLDKLLTPELVEKLRKITS